MKRFLALSLCSVLVSNFAGAAPSARYRIDLRNGSHVFAKDLPVRRGTVVTFHQSPSGALTGLPEESIARIQAGSSEVSLGRPGADAVVRGRMTAIQTLAQPLQPGDVLVLGPTGSGSAQAAAQNDYGAAGAPMSGVNTGYGTNAPIGAYGASSVPPGFAPNGQPFVPVSGDLARAASGNPPTMGQNGFPVTGNATPVSTGPNGTPVVAGSSQTAQPGAAQPIGPSGTPTLAQPGTPGATPPNIGPNGTPILAPSGAPGSNPPAIAPNGTPATGQPGTPSSAQPATAPNGTPASPPPGSSPKS
jgi:hypothetical protein